MLYEIVKNLEQELNDTIRGCCGATLGKIKQSKPQSSEDDDGGVPLWGYIVAGVFGLVVLVGLAILVAVLVMRKKSVGTGSYYNNSGTRSTENLESKWGYFLDKSMKQPIIFISLSSDNTTGSI